MKKVRIEVCEDKDTAETHKQRLLQLGFQNVLGPYAAEEAVVINRLPGSWQKVLRDTDNSLFVIFGVKS